MSLNKNSLCKNGLNKEQFEFIKNYYELLKKKDVENLDHRFAKQLNALYDSDEINETTYKIIKAAISIGNLLGKLSEEEQQIIEEAVKIGIELKDVKNSRTVLSRMSSSSSSSSSSNNSVKGDPCSKGTFYSGSSRSGC